jgi:hypothetical protein
MVDMNAWDKAKRRRNLKDHGDEDVLAWFRAQGRAAKQTDYIFLTTE